MNPLVDSWLRAVHATGVEISVTLLVSGRLITGMLTPIQRYEDWEREVLRRAFLEGGKFTLPSVELSPITADYSEKVRKAWPDLERELYDDSREAKGFAYLCLRNATVHEPIPAASLKSPFVLVAVDAIAAFTPGIQEHQSTYGAEVDLT